MKVVCSIGGQGKSRLYLDVQVCYVTPGTIVFERLVPQLRIPILTLQYDLADLLPVSTILGEMGKRQEEPEVYIWDEDEAEPEVAIFFKTKEPGKTVLESISGNAGKTLSEMFVLRGCEQAFTVAEVNLSGRDMATLITDYKRCGQHLVVDIRESDTGFVDEPLHRFVRATLKRERPVFEL